MTSLANPSVKTDETTSRLLSIRVRFLIATSSVILVFVAILVTLDYQREIRHHFDETR
jgi:hypothetical protein